MNRIGLFVALAIAALVGAIFGIYPELDIAVARFFLTPDGNFFPSRWMMAAREASTWLIVGLVAAVLLALLVKLLLPRRRLLIPARAMIFLLVTLALAPGLVVNAGLKDHWPRSRPIDVTQFGGNERFVAWWDPRGECPANCSFVSGEGSAAFWALAPAALTPPAWRAAAYGAAVAFGAGIGVLRMAFGAHFMTDVVFAGVLTFLIIWLMHGLIYRWPATRLSEEKLERAIERVMTPVHDFVRGKKRSTGREGA
jgi:membrane-associated PAP2 superfamily phosphatase